MEEYIKKDSVQKEDDLVFPNQDWMTLTMNLKRETEGKLDELIAPHKFSLEDATFLKRVFNKVFNNK